MEKRTMKVKDFKVNDNEDSMTVFALTECGQLFRKTCNYGSQEDGPEEGEWENISDDLPVDD